MSALALTQLTLSHFRSHKLSRMECGAGPVALYGPNGAGKTNVLEAVSLFSPGRGLRRASAEAMTRKPQALGWKVSGLLSAQNQLNEVEMWSEAGTPRSIKINSKPVAQTALGQMSRVLWLIPAMDRLWIEAADGRRRFLDRMTLSFFPNHAEHSLNYEKAMRERNRLLKDQVRDPAWYSVLEARMAKAGATLHQNRLQALSKLEIAQTASSTSFPAARLELLHAEGDMPATEEALSTALAESRPRDIAAGRTLIGPHRADLYGTFMAKDVPAKECSTGEQKALLISLILANARALASELDTVPLLILDEVAAHLDADRRVALYAEISALGAQAWMTGTGLELFDGLDPSAPRLLVTDDNGESQVSDSVNK